MFQNKENKLLNVGIISLLMFMFFYVLTIGESLLIPFIIALLFSFAIIGLSNFFKKFKIPAIISFILSLATYIFLFWAVGKMIGSNIQDLVDSLPEYQTKIYDLISQFFEFTGVPEPTSISEILNKLNLQYIFSSVIGGFTSIFSSMGIILFYVMFILLEYRFFKDKLSLMIDGNSQKKNILEIIEKIKIDIKGYFVIKSIVSFMTASLSYIVMFLFGLDFAIFWALLIFILNFIPSIGSIIAVSFPILLSLIQPLFTFYDTAFLTIGLIGIQVLMGNIIEPKFMGNKLNLSPLVIIIALGFWGSIWGIVGMLLSVPIMVIINIILAKIPATRSIAILLSEKGELQVDGGEEVVKTRKRVINKIKEKFVKKKK